MCIEIKIFHFHKGTRRTNRFSILKQIFSSWELPTSKRLNRKCGPFFLLVVTFWIKLLFSRNLACRPSIYLCVRRLKSNDSFKGRCKKRLVSSPDTTESIKLLGAQSSKLLWVSAKFFFTSKHSVLFCCMLFTSPSFPQDKRKPALFPIQINAFWNLLSVLRNI